MRTDAIDLISVTCNVFKFHFIANCLQTVYCSIQLLLYEFCRRLSKIEIAPSCQLSIIYII